MHGSVSGLGPPVSQKERKNQTKSHFFVFFFNNLTRGKEESSRAVIGKQLTAGWRDEAELSYQTEPDQLLLFTPVNPFAVTFDRKFRNFSVTFS